MPGWIGARPSVYLTPIIIICSIYGLEFILEKLNRILPKKLLLSISIKNIVIHTICFLLIFLSLRVNLFHIKHKTVYHQQSFSIIEYVFENYHIGDQIFLYSASEHAVNYWVDYKKIEKYHPVTIMKRDYLYQPNPQIDKVIPKDIFNTTGKIYFLFSHYWGGVDKTIRDYLIMNQIKFKEKTEKGALLIETGIISKKIKNIPNVSG